MTEATETAVAEGQIRELLDRWQDAVNKKDIEGLMRFYAPDVVAFDVIPPLRFVGAADYRKNWEWGFEMCPDQGTFRSQEVTLAVGDEIAFCHRLNNMTGTDKSGQAFDCWVRWTVCFKKIDGQWLIVHEHISVPVDMETNQGVMELTPSDK